MIVEDRHQPKQSIEPPLAEPEVDNLEEAKQLIAEHPVATTLGAFAVGALLGLLQPSKKGGVVRTAIGGIAMALLRDAVMNRVSAYAGSWIDMKSREEAASRQRETEAFLEH